MQYMYLMDRSSLEKSLAMITVNGLVCLVARTGCKSAFTAYSASTLTDCSTSYVYKWETMRGQLANKLVDGRRRSGRRQRPESSLL
jgi:hypothetical protein